MVMCFEGGASVIVAYQSWWGGTCVGAGKLTLGVHYSTPTSAIHSNEREQMEELLTFDEWQCPPLFLSCNVNIAVCLVERQVNISQSGA
jgi:hypothetical protein